MKIINVLKVKCFHTSSLYHTESEYYMCLKKKRYCKAQHIHVCKSQNHERPNKKLKHIFQP